VNLASLQNLPQRLLIYSQVITSRCLNILVPGKLLDEGNVRARMKQGSTEGVPQQMGRDFRRDSCTRAQFHDGA